jgi:hypothetical protein
MTTEKELMQTEMDLDADEVTDLKETADERFKRVVNPRVKAAVERLRMIKRMFEGANARNYEWTPEQANRLIGILQGEVNDIADLVNKTKAQKDHLPLI